MTRGPQTVVIVEGQGGQGGQDDARWVMMEPPEMEYSHQSEAPEQERERVVSLLTSQSPYLHNREG